MVVSIRSVSGVSSHRSGLEAELSEPDLSGRVACAGFAKDHCWSCEATATSTMVFDFFFCSAGLLGVYCLVSSRRAGTIYVLRRQVLRMKPRACSSTRQPEAWLWMVEQTSRSHRALLSLLL